jgi:pimeloyl-ACP methyl ester carboxylesterase/2-polyprenyl-6-methoxyphenol hydroxylase-like FAD-dependent oxidoreductase
MNWTDAPIVESEPNGRHAIVVGGSIAGLLAAWALSDAYDRVTLIERDPLPAPGEGHRSVPHGRQPHLLIAAAQQALETIFPGIGEEMVNDGAATYAALGDGRFVVAGNQLARVDMGLTAITASRPFIEGHLRRRVSALENVELRSSCEVGGLLGGAGRVSGVRIGDAAGGGEQALGAELVVAATGRSARVSAWLEQLGYGRAEESELRVDIGYASRRYRLPVGALADKVILVGARPGFPRSAGIFAEENGTWMLFAGGYGEHRPPTEEVAHDAFVETVAPPDVVAALREGEPLGGVVPFGFPANRRRHYERMRLFPGGLLVAGDAMCSFNPLYGQGMAVAALEALALRRCLEHGDRDLQRRYFRAARRIVDHAWQMAVNGDLALPEVTGRRPFSVRLANAYTKRLRERATEDGELTAAFVRVAGMLEPPNRLLRPAIAARAFGPRRRDPVWPGRPLRGPVRRRTLRVGGIATPLREAGERDSSEAVVFIHGVPGSGADFEPLLSAAGQAGRAVAWDAPGFGRADKPRSFEQNVSGHAAFIDRALADLGIERVHLVVHDFGGFWGLGWAARNPGRLASATLICTGAQLGERWHGTARIWRTRHAGELFMATATRRSFRRGLKRANPARLPGPLLDRMYADFDRDTRDAILRLYRSVESLGGESRRLVDALRPHRVPALVIWGAGDPFLPARLAERQREAFPEAQVEVLEACGHWPFVEDAERVEELLVGFLAQRMGNSKVRGPSTMTSAA